MSSSSWNIETRAPSQVIVMSNPILSIITVAYNSEATIQRTLDSVKDVDRDDVEHIIVDGGSSDNTLKIAARYEYLQVYSGPDKGIYDAMNKGVQLSSGKYVCFLNSDDTYRVSSISALIRIIRDNPNADLFLGSCHVVNSTNRLAKIFSPISIGIPPFSMPAPHMSIVYRKSSFLAVGCYDLRYRLAADYDHIIRVLLKTDRVYVYPFSIGSFFTGGRGSHIASLFETFSIRRKYGFHPLLCTFKFLESLVKQALQILLLALLK